MAAQFAATLTPLLLELAGKDPVILVIRHHIEDASAYGLASAVFSRNHGEAIARRLRVGMTSINDALMVSQNPPLPFGGRGDSGYGRNHGIEGLREFGYPHAITCKAGPGPISTSTFGMPPGAVAAALAAARHNILAEEDPGSN